MTPFPPPSWLRLLDNQIANTPGPCGSKRSQQRSVAEKLLHIAQHQVFHRGKSLVSTATTLSSARNVPTSVPGHGRWRSNCSASRSSVAGVKRAFRRTRGFIAGFLGKCWFIRNGQRNRRAEIPCSVSCRTAFGSPWRRKLHRRFLYPLALRLLSNGLHVGEVKH